MGFHPGAGTSRAAVRALLRQTWPVEGEPRRGLSPIMFGPWTWRHPTDTGYPGGADRWQTRGVAADFPAMALQVYNTLSRTKVPLSPLVPGAVGIYLCGPTVYDDCHIGHLAGPVVFDAVARWLAVRRLRVRLVNNITDIDDKIIGRSQASGESWQDITSRYTRQYLGYLSQLQVSSITDHPRCSDHLPGMVAYIADLVRSGRAYQAADGIYYDVSLQADYGKLSGRHTDDMIAGARVVRDSGLRNPGDFCLWKAAKPGEPSWDSPWGAGRPGWHIECSVMSTALLGGTFDIHAGGDDLKFPHHENEIAQAEAHGDAYARIWMHNGLIQYEGVKVGKSDPRMRDAAFRRQFMADHLLDTYGPEALRFALLDGHYRRPTDFAPSHLEAAKSAVQRLRRLVQAVNPPGPRAPVTPAEVLDRGLDEVLGQRREAFAAAMDDDFNTHEAIAQLFALATDARARSGPDQQTALVLLRDLGGLLGLLDPGAEERIGTAAGQTAPTVPGDGALLGDIMEAIIAARRSARGRRDFATADRIRTHLTGLGIVLHDQRDRTTWETDRRVEASGLIELVVQLQAAAPPDEAAALAAHVVTWNAGSKPTPSG